MTPTNKYLRLSEEIAEIKHVKGRLSDSLKRLEGQLEEIKMDIMREYESNGVLPDDGLVVKKVPPKLIVVDESKVHSGFWRHKREINKADLNKKYKLDGVVPDGCAIDNGGLTVAIKG